jgi:hypothetical protein
LVHTKGEKRKLWRKQYSEERKDMSDKKLYKVDMNDYRMRPFFVVAMDESGAARTAEIQLKEWGYPELQTTSIELIAAGQYGPSDVGWLLAN